MYKAIVIGSGAGGAPVAATLAARWGDGVAIVEAGKQMRARDFNQRSTDMIPALYVQSGMQATEDGTLPILQGQTVGGSTVINDALCFRPPPEIVDRWRPYGVRLGRDELESLADEVEARLRVQPIPKTHINRANYLVGLGAARLGWRGERLRHNAPACLQCGFRHYGCAYDAKQSMNLTYVPDAIAAGAVLHTETRATQLHRQGGRWRVITDRETLEAEIVVVCAGAIQTPTLLLRSGIGAGANLQVHLQTIAWGDFEEPVDGHNGIPMSYGVLQFADIYGQQGPGYLIEGCCYQPTAMAAYAQLQGPELEAFLARYRYLAGAVMVLRSSSRGRVSLGDGGRPVIDYPVEEEDRTRIEHFYRQAVPMFQAAGARRVLLSHRDHGWLDAPPAAVHAEPGRAFLYVAHPFGGATRGDVLDGDGRVVGHDGLWVLDASGFPEALGVNPQITIASLALRGARQIVES